MEDANASSLDQSPVSENQEKLVHVYFGVFFDAMDESVLGQFFNRGEYLRKGEEFISEVRESSIYKKVDEVAAWAKLATDILPDNPVSNLIKTGLGAKQSGENLVDDAMGFGNRMNDKIDDLSTLADDPIDKLTNTLMDKAPAIPKMPDIPTSFGKSFSTDSNDDKKEEVEEEVVEEVEEEGEDEEGRSTKGLGDKILGSRSIISKMEPSYIGCGNQLAGFSLSSDSGAEETPVVNFNHRIYTTGAITNQELQQKEPEEEKDEKEKSKKDDNNRKQYAKDAIDSGLDMGMGMAEQKVDSLTPEPMDENRRNECATKAIGKVMGEITNTLFAGKQSVHFDIFGYKKDIAVNNFIQQIEDELKKNQNITEISIDYTGLYEEFHSRNEVMDNMNSDTKLRFRNQLNKL